MRLVLGAFCCLALIANAKDNTALDMLAKWKASPPEPASRYESPHQAKTGVADPLADKIAGIRQLAVPGTGTEVKEFEKVPFERQQLSDQLKSDRFSISRNAVMTAGNRAKAKSSKAVTLVDRYYAAKDYSIYSGEANAFMHIYKAESGDWKLTNIYNAGDTLDISFNEADGTVSIPPQNIGYSSRYEGNIFIGSANAETKEVSSTEPITGVIDESGNIKLNSWAVFLADGPTAGGIFDLYTSSDWMASNTTISITDNTGALAEFPSFIEQPYENEIKIHNFAGSGVAISAALTPAKKVKISPQLIATNMMYGAFYCYAANMETGTVDTKNPIIGTGTESKITLGGWVVGARLNPSMVMLVAASTEINTTAKIKYPSPMEVKFDGAGTEASPYLIKQASDIAMLSQAVGEGESYKSNFFKLAGNIDMSALTGIYSPVGDALNPFEGTFDGGGATISNLKVDNKGFFYGGLFGYLGASSTVKNLKLDKATVSGNSQYYGAVAGYSKGVISNVEVSGNVVTDATIVGGIAGVSENEISNSSFAGKVSGNGSIGGIVGDNHGIISFCHATATVALTAYVSSTDSDAGGIAGESFLMASAVSQNCSITDCYFSGTVSDTPGYGFTGGIAGLAVNTKIERCFNVGTLQSVNSSVDSDTGSGGIVGLCSSVEVVDSYNAGSIVRNGTSEGAGGLAGFLSVTYTTYPEFIVEGISTFTNCYNSGIVQSSSTNKDKGVYGRTFTYNDYDPAPDMFLNSYFDFQTVGFKSDRFGKPSSYFTSGQLPEGFKSGVWTSTTGRYPALAAIGNNDAAKLASASVAFGEGETVKKVKTELTLNSDASITWKLYNGESFVDETGSLKITGNKVSIKDQYASDILAAMDLVNGNIKVYYLSVVPKVFEGDGTEVSPYQIRNKEDFILLDKAVRQYSQPHEGDYFVMTNDIDFGLSDDFQGVGQGSVGVFGGTFDGQGNYVHNLKIQSVKFDESGKAVAEGSYWGAGLFNVTSPTSVVKNINIADDCQFTFWGEGAAVVGYAQGRVENCRNYAAINSVNNYAAGIVGVLAQGGVVSGCYNAGNVLGGATGAAGIVGFSVGLVELSQNDGRVAADFFNDYTKKGSQELAGGIVARNYGTVDRCANNGDVVSYAGVGGIVGDVGITYKAGNVTNNINTGLVTSLTTTEERGGIIAYAMVGGAGTVANNYYDSSINNNGGFNNSTAAGITGVSTADLVGGKALDGLSKDDFLFVPGVYPGLTAFAYEDASVAMRSTYVKFADGEIRTNMINDAALAKGSRIEWTLTESSNFKLENGMLKVVPPTEMVVVTDTLTAVYDKKYTKVYELKTIPQNLFDGKGSASDPYLIKSIDDMTKLADFIEASSMEYDGYFFKLVNDLDYTDAAFKPISTGNVNFQGNFNGNGKTISNYNYSDITSKTGKYIGFFGNIGGNGVVSDLTLDGTFAGHSYVGAFAGKLYGTIRNCVNKTDVTIESSRAAGFAGEAFEGAQILDSHNEAAISTPKSNYAGGLIAKMNAGTLIDNCYNTGAISAKSGYVGGLVAYADGTIRNSYNSADLSSTSNVGGIIGASLKNDTITNCYNTGNITGTSSKVGGIIGGATSQKSLRYIKDCHNSGTITGKGDTGGIAGSLQYSSKLEDCYNEGTIVSTGANAGGICGLIKGDEGYESSALRCYNTGAINGAAGCTGGLFGSVYDEEITVEDCYNLGNITVESEKKALGAGGIAGDLSGTALRCWNVGNVNSVGYGVAGVAGYSSGTVDNCVNLGDVVAGGLGNEKGTYGNAGGIWGYGRSKIYNCYNMGSVTGPSNIAGINGSLFSDAIIENSYNAGKLVVTTEGETSYGNIAPLSESLASKVTLTNNYFDSDVNASNESDAISGAKGLPTQQMFAAELGEAFANNRAAYPVLASLSDNAWLNFAAAYVEFAVATDNISNVTDHFYVGKLAGVEWTASDNIELTDEGEASTAEVGAAWVKASADINGKVLEKTIELTIKQATGGVDDAFAGKECIARVYYDLSGVEVAKPVVGTLYIVKSIYGDGSISVEKQYFKER